MPVQEFSSRLEELIKSRKMSSANKRSVRRCLFGLPDHDALKRELDNQLKQTGTEMRSTWNFDPLLDQPLDGRYEWCLPDKDEYVPEYYRKGYRPTKFRKRNLVDLDDDKSEITPPASPTVLARLTEESESDVEAEQIAMKRENETTPESRVVRQARIDEMFRVKKRRLSDDEAFSDEERPSKSARQ